jgi:transcriptional regulator with XRE-family HTH domain
MNASSRIRSLRVARGLSQGQVARAMNPRRSQSWVSLVEAGFTAPTEAEVSAIEQAISDAHKSKSTAPAALVLTHRNANGSYYTITHNADGSVVRADHASYGEVDEHCAKAFHEEPEQGALSRDEEFAEVGA